VGSEMCIRDRYYRESRIQIDSDDDELTIYGDGLDVDIESTTRIDITAPQTRVIGSEFAQLESGNNYIWVEGTEGAFIQLGDRTFEFSNVDDSPKLKLPAGADIVNSDGESVLGGGGANLQDIIVDSPANMFDEGSGNFVNFNVNGEDWMRLGTSGNEKLQLITNYNSVGRNIWEFGTDGSLTVPGDIKSQGNINIDINLSNSTLRRWHFGEDGNLTLPEAGDIVDINGNSVISGLLVITPEDYEVPGVRTLAFTGAGVSVDRIDDITTVTIEGGGDNSYTPEEPDHWNSPTVNTIAAALDELAAKVAALENFEIDGGNAYTPAAGELLIDGNGA
jgi:hypothetical protein